MIGEISAFEQVKRLDVLSDYPRDSKPAIRELVLALQCSDSEAIARDVIDSYLGLGALTGTCPKPADIRRAANDREPQEEPEWMQGPRPVIRCECHGWGTVGPEGKRDYCRCPIGQSLRHDVTTWRVKPYEETRYTPESWLEIVANAKPLAKPGDGLMQVHPSWAMTGSRVRMAAPRGARRGG
jgi:hypothetical protein